jgi:hypothetical protein
LTTAAAGDRLDDHCRGCVSRWLLHSFIVILSIVLAAATTLAIAWQVARNAPTFDDNQVPVRWSHPQGAAWLYRRDESFGALRLRGQFAKASATGDRMVIDTVPPPDWSAMSVAAPRNSRITMNWEEAFGWPMPAMMATIYDNGVTVRYQNVIDLGSHPTDWSMRLYLPTKVIWTGAIINTLIFTPLSWLIIMLPMMLLLRVPRWLRKRKGRCPNCGYDLRGRLEAGCSECGWRRSVDERTPDRADSSM